MEAFLVSTLSVTVGEVATKRRWRSAPQRCSASGST